MHLRVRNAFASTEGVTVSFAIKFQNKFRFGSGFDQKHPEYAKKSKDNSNSLTDLQRCFYCETGVKNIRCDQIDGIQVSSWKYRHHFFWSIIFKGVK